MIDAGDVLSALVDGKMTPPPSSHFLDHLVRRYVLGEEAIYTCAKDIDLLTKEPGTTALVSGGSQLPECDLCRIKDREARTARYDGPCTRRPRAPWAFMCSDCFALNAPPVLGMGRAQYLFTTADVPEDMREAFFRARDYWQGRGLDVPPHHPFEQPS
ncbi:MAG: hypothetical protein R2725_12380 [Solirubrobacterales bacterium]